MFVLFLLLIHLAAGTLDALLGTTQAVGAPVLLVFPATEGNRWADRFGPDPKIGEPGPRAHGVPPQPNVA